MSTRNGDRARAGIERKKKMIRRLRTEALRVTLAAEPKVVVESQPVVTDK